MPTLDITRNYDDDLDFTEAQMDDIKESLEIFFNSTKLDSANFQTGGITDTSITASSVTSAKIPAEAVTAAKVAAGAVTTAKIADNAITLDKLVDKALTTDGTDPGLDGIVKTASITASTTDFDGDVRLIRSNDDTELWCRSFPSGYGELPGVLIDTGARGSASTYNYEVQYLDSLSTTWAGFTGASLSITTGGRAVMVLLEPSGPTSGIEHDELGSPDLNFTALKMVAMELT
jgi:hypothetical protein